MLNIWLFLYHYSNFNRFIYNFRGEKNRSIKGERRKLFTERGEYKVGKEETVY